MTTSGGKAHEVISVFDLFKVGIGPSSSHSVGPMVAARRFAARQDRAGRLDRVARVRIDLFGSLALTGRGHGTDRAVLLGLMGDTPEAVDTATVEARVQTVGADRRLALLGRQEIPFDPDADLVFRMDTLLDFHPNGMTFTAFAADGGEVERRTYYSVGGGFVVAEDEIGRDLPRNFSAADLPLSFTTAAELLALGRREGLTIAEIAWRNELALRGEDEVRAGLAGIWQAMTDCIERGCATEGVLPGGLKVRRRAPALCRQLRDRPERSFRDPTRVLDWVNLFALAVNEENAAGGRVVTAPTNGAAGIIPAVLTYYDRIHPSSTEKGIETFLLTASAIGQLYKRNASISGAEVGCQGEVGVACSMAAAGLAAALGGTNAQVENAAEIGMEHNLGMTCDPVGGLVQIPCIERNAMAAVKAINAASLALKGDGTHFVSLDAVIETMRQTGLDMQSKYKETSQGGLAVNVVEC
ncbi:MAG: L-serine ammonia-lyase [Hyphomicrobiales bacterium]|nr:L-serine ammonia-lyase [Hyphomicrobiales bacterium]